MNKYHFIATIGTFPTTRYFGIVVEKSRQRMSDPNGTFYGIVFYIYDVALIMGICLH